MYNSLILFQIIIMYVLFKNYEIITYVNVPENYYFCVYGYNFL